MTVASSLNPELTTVSELFADGISYLIPLYQRNYAWGAEQVEQLVSDVRDSLILQPETGSGARYFLGNLITTARSDDGAYEVVDGQQRLTTLFLLRCAIAAERAKRTKESGESVRVGMRVPLTYEARARATTALQFVAETVDGIRVVGASDHEEDGRILDNYRLLQQLVSRMDVVGAVSLDSFDAYLDDRVVLVRAELPLGTDLNRYFEIMNTRGQQLQHVDIVKARLMAHLDDPRDRDCFHRAWDACSDMDGYLQMSLAQGADNTGIRRRKLCRDDWSWPQFSDFDGLKSRLLDDVDASDPVPTRSESRSLTEAVEAYAARGRTPVSRDADEKQFRSPITFDSFLLHVLRLMTDEDETEDEGRLDDKRLVVRFERAGDAASDSEGSAVWVRRFLCRLVIARFNFDSFVIKRQHTAASGEDGDWSLKRLYKASKRSGPTYRNTGTAVEQSDDATESSDMESDSQLVLLQSMLRITFTSPKSMHWITKALRLCERWTSEDAVNVGELETLLRNYARERVAALFFDSTEEPTGFSIPRIAFTYYDFLLAVEASTTNFRFVFRNSIEHFWPQHPDREMAAGQAGVSDEWLHSWGNLALVSVTANSKFSNSVPQRKRDYRDTVGQQSLKLQAMTQQADQWNDTAVKRHRDESLGRLANDLGSHMPPSTWFRD